MVLPTIAQIIKLVIIVIVVYLIGKIVGRLIFPKEGDVGITVDPIAAIQNSLTFNKDDIGSLGNLLNSREDRQSTPGPGPTNPIAAKWCSVGSFQGVNGCVEVGDANLCTSGQVFSSRELCLNPATGSHPDLAGNRQSLRHASTPSSSLLPTPVIFSRPIIQPLAPNPLYT